MFLIREKIINVRYINLKNLTDAAFSLLYIAIYNNLLSHHRKIKFLKSNLYGRSESENCTPKYRQTDGQTHQDFFVMETQVYSLSILTIN